ncbi:DUF5666 domain-containing protein, partial [Rhodopirellula baltica]
MTALFVTVLGETIPNDPVIIEGPIEEVRTEVRDIVIDGQVIWVPESAEILNGNEPGEFSDIAVGDFAVVAALPEEGELTAIFVVLEGDNEFPAAQGPVTQIDREESVFFVRQREIQVVDGTEFVDAFGEPSSFTDLNVNDEVEVYGERNSDAASPQEGVIVADLVVNYGAEEEQFFACGPAFGITIGDEFSGFAVGQFTFFVDGDTEFVDPENEITGLENLPENTELCVYGVALNDGTGAFRAYLVEILRIPDFPVNVLGFIEDVNTSDTTIVVAGVNVVVTEETGIFLPSASGEESQTDPTHGEPNGTFADLAVGQFADVFGFAEDNTTVTADFIVIQDVVELSGPVSEINVFQSRFDVDGKRVRVTQETVWIDAECPECDHYVGIETLLPGDVVEVVGIESRNDGGHERVQALEVTIVERGDPGEPQEVRGTVNSVFVFSGIIIVEDNAYQVSDNTELIDATCEERQQGGDDCELRLRDINPGDVVEIVYLPSPNANPTGFGAFDALSVTLVERGVPEPVVFFGNVSATDGNVIFVDQTPVLLTTGTLLIDGTCDSEDCPPLGVEDFMVGDYVQVEALNTGEGVFGVSITLLERFDNEPQTS